METKKKPSKQPVIEVRAEVAYPPKGNSQIMEFTTIEIPISRLLNPPKEVTSEGMRMKVVRYLDDLISLTFN